MDNGERPSGAEAVAAWMASGETLLAYCKRTGQSYWSLRRWRLKHGQDLGIEIKRRMRANVGTSTAAASPLIPIEIISPGLAPSGSSIEIRLQGQRTLVVSSDIDTATLRRVIAAVEAAR